MTVVHKFRLNRDLSLSSLISVMYSPSLQSLHVLVLVFPFFLSTLPGFCSFSVSPTVESGGSVKQECAMPYLSFRPLKNLSVHLLYAPYTCFSKGV